MHLEITLTNGRVLVIQGTHVGSTADSYGPMTFVESAGPRGRVFVCPSANIASLMKREDSNTESQEPQEGSTSTKPGSEPYAVVLANGRASTVNGTFLSFSDRSFGLLTYIENGQARVFQCPSLDVRFICFLPSLVSDSGATDSLNAEGSASEAEGASLSSDDGRPFVFVSYKRQDMPRIVSHLRRLSEWGYSIWYDKGIPGGSEWDAMIEDRVARCQLLLVFLSQEAADSKWVRREIKFADGKGKPILAVRLGEVTLRHGLNITLSQYQMISEEADDFSAELHRAIEYVRLL